MLLEVDRLAVHYGVAQALEDVSLQIAEGEVVALIGANGAGKTTLLRTLSGLQRATSGRIAFQGESLRGVAAHAIVRRGIAHIPEGRVVFGPMSVRDNLLMGAYLRKRGRQIDDDLERMYVLFPVLKERRRQLAESLSGGEQQMLAVARALMAAPKLLLMDEPSMGLSPLMVENIGRIIQEIHGMGIGILLVEQNATMALALADRAYVLEVGRVVLEGPASEIMGNARVREAYLGG